MFIDIDVSIDVLMKPILSARTTKRKGTVITLIDGNFVGGNELLLGQQDTVR